MHKYTHTHICTHRLEKFILVRVHTSHFDPLKYNTDLQRQTEAATKVRPGSTKSGTLRVGPQQNRGCKSGGPNPRADRLHMLICPDVHMLIHHSFFTC